MKTIKSLFIATVVMLSSLGVANAAANWDVSAIQGYGVIDKDNASGQHVTFECNLYGSDVNIYVRTSSNDKMVEPNDLIIDGVSYSGSPQLMYPTTTWWNFYDALRSGKTLVVVGEGNQKATFNLQGSSKAFGPYNDKNMMCNPDRI